MATQQQIGKLIDRLTELTAQKKLTWKTTADEDTFLTSAGQSVVTVTSDEDDYRIRLLDGSGRVIEELIAGASESTSPAIGIHSASSLMESLGLATQRDRLQRLYELARRSALHADEAVADLLASLEKIA